MKIAIIGDTHLGFDHYGPRKEDSFRNVKEAFDIALAEKVDLIIQTGDMFHERLPKPEVTSPVIKLLNSVSARMKPVKLVNSVKEGKEKLQTVEIPPIVVIYGTHERRPPEYVNPLQMLHSAGVLYCLDRESAVVEIGNNRIGLHGLSGVPEIYAKEVLKKWNPRAFPDMKNFFLIHQNFQELLPLQPPEILTYGDLPREMDLHILGHIHWKQEDTHPISNAPIILPGSTVKTQMRSIESKMNKGIYILDVGEKISMRWIELKRPRKLYYEIVKIDGMKPSEVLITLKENLVKKLEYHNHPLIPLVRYSLRGDLAEGFIPSDLSFKGLENDKVILNIDKSKVSSKKLGEKAKLIADLKSQKISIDELGVKILADKLGMKNTKKLSDVFAELSQGNLEGAEQLL